MPCSGCQIDAQCDSCLHDSFMHLKGTAMCRGDRFADELAAKRRQPWVPWPIGSERVRKGAMRWVEDLTRDPRLRERLAAAVEEQAAKRWAELRPL